MNTIKATRMSSNATINKALLSGLDLEDKFDSHWRVIDALRYEYEDHNVSRQFLVNKLYSLYEIDKHINEYDDDVLTFLVKLGLEFEKIAHAPRADFAKDALISRFACLEFLVRDRDEIRSFYAQSQLSKLRRYSKKKKESYEAFLALGQEICRVNFIPFTSKLKVTGYRPSRFRNKHYEDSYGVITYTSKGYRFDVTIPMYSMYQFSEWEEYQFKTIFDDCSCDFRGIHLRKSNLTLDRLVALVHLFFEHLD